MFGRKLLAWKDDLTALQNNNRDEQCALSVEYLCDIGPQLRKQTW